MNQDEIVASLKDHLDGLQKIVRWSLLFALAFWWAGIQNADNIKALGVEFTRSQALFVATSTYLVINLTILDKLWRIGDLITLLDHTNISKGLGKIAYHSWELNPFAYFGSSLPAKIHSSKGFGLLIIVWWVCNSSIYSLSDNIQTPLAQSLQAAFLVIGLCSIISVNRTFKIILERTSKFENDLHIELKKTVIFRSLLTFLGIGFGGLFAFYTIALQ